MQELPVPVGFAELAGHDLHRDRPRSPDLFYLCRRCGSLVASTPPDNQGCRCGDVFVDIDAGRLLLRNPDRVSLLRKET